MSPLKGTACLTKGPIKKATLKSTNELHQDTNWLWILHLFGPRVYYWFLVKFYRFFLASFSQRGTLVFKNGLRSASFMCCIIVPSPLSPFRGKLMEGGSLGSLRLLKVCRLLHQQVVKVDVSVSCDVSRWPTVHFSGTNGNSQSKRLHFHSNYQIRSFSAAPCIMGQTRQPH